MTRRLSVDLEVSTAEGSPRAVRLTAADDTPAGEALDVLGEHLGLHGSRGAVQARSLVSGTWVPRATTLGRLPLLRGERLSLSVGLAPSGTTGSLSRWPGQDTTDVEGRLLVRRPPRRVTPEPSGAVQLPVRRTVRAARRFPLGSMLIPLLLGAALVAVTRRWEVALFAVFSPVMVGWNYVEERRARRDEIAEHGATYEQSVEDASARIRSVAADWAAWRHRHFPPPSELTDEILRLGTRLWERQPGDPDFLGLRLGLATQVAPVDLKRDEWRQGSTDEHDFSADPVVGPVPAVTSLEVHGSLAVLGDEHARTGTVAWLVAQLCGLHSPADLLVAGVLAPSSVAESFEWLPHLATGFLPVPALARDRASAAALLEAVAALGRTRREQAGGRNATPSRPWLAVVVDGRVDVDAALLNEVLSFRDVGIVTLWFGEDTRAVPTTVPVLLQLDGAGARLRGLRDGTDLQLTPERLGEAQSLDVSAALAALRDAGDARRVSSVPDQVALEDLVPELISPTAMRRRWQSASPETLLARLGATAEGPLDLDLGPSGSHVLVGGTTGSGKSELLQSLVASLAAAYPPDRVAFLLVDYKGGAAFKDAMHFPHCVGVVTDLDEHLTRRVLRALDAEIRRREHTLAGAGVRDVAELRRVRPDVRLEELVIVVDEFAALAKEIPEFVEGVVDLAARGRSLGLRLVLATQRPAGVISERIRANVGVRIALRVNDEADSLDVIDDRVAAHVSRRLPGRGYQRIHRELVEFQSAYVGGPARTAADAPIAVVELEGGEPRPTRRTTAASRSTTLEALVDAAAKVVRLGGWESPHVPWLPALPTVLTVDEVQDGETTEPGAVTLGLADLPERQAQRRVVFDLERQRNLMVFGTSRSGKTTTLRTIAAGLVETHAPDQLQLYCLDFAGHGLHVFEPAPHCLGVVGPDDLGRVSRVLRRLAATVDERKRALAASGSPSFAQLRDEAGRPVPRVVVLVDGYAGVVSSLERPEGGRLLDLVEQLIREGAGVGVHVLLTADRRASVPNAVSSVVTTRLVLRLAERDEYAILGVDSALAAGARLGPGRGFVQGTTEVQVAVRASADPAAEQEALARLVADLGARHTRAFRPVAPMPARVDVLDLPSAPHTWVLPVGVGEREVDVVATDLRDGHLLVAGPARSGRTSALLLLADRAATAPDPARCVFVAARRASSYPGGPGDSHDVVDVHDPAAVEAALADLRRMQAEGRPVLCLCDDVDAFPDPVSAAFEALARASRDTALRFVVATDNRAGLRAYGGLVPEVRKSKAALLLSPEIDLDGDLVGVRLRPPLDSVHAPGRAVLVTNGTSELVQVATGDLLRNNPSTPLRGTTGGTP